MLCDYDYMLVRYVGSLVYSDDGFESASFGGGRIVGTSTGSEVHYFLTDHLGSTRVVVKVTPMGRIDLDRKDYYPFGKEWSQSDMPTSDNRYTFSGKELQRAGSMSIDYHDFGARYYDPEGGIFLQHDPLAKKYYSWSPYSYCTGNPVRFADYKGKNPVAIGAGVAIVELTLISAGVITTGYLLTKNNDGSITFRSYGTWGERQERKEADQARQQQLGVQKSINDNFPDPDDYDPNNNPTIRNKNKRIRKLMIGIGMGAVVFNDLYKLWYLLDNLENDPNNNSNDENKDNTETNTNQDNTDTDEEREANDVSDVSKAEAK